MWGGGDGVIEFYIFVSSPLSNSSFNAILNVVGLLYRVINPALFHVLGRVYRGNLVKKVRLAGGT